MNLKKLLSKLQGELKDTERSNNGEWAAAFNSGLIYAMKTAEQLEESDKTKMNLEELERANILVKDLKNLEVIAESELCNIRIKHPNGKIDYVHIDGEIEKRIQKVFEGYADELKAELKELGVEYENN
jgi:precorrin-6B methylase 2